ncbi:hypothetical protein Q9Q94_04930 [Uliginosibacterium sp. 31-16]|uniref:hypothetical protein n=1 Tax=Uliginosibacterium sp. 31-16 TaxID=3068315 RepID=UPI00273E7C1D|nr:hypothetical protein [Uliginosibacterium sp. 31-16]MDP5238860.1 hypothetical protein [Uliginosibacterium sp. 31-16]
MNPNQLVDEPGFPLQAQRTRSLPRAGQLWRNWSWLGGIALLLGLLIAAYTAGCMVGREQERDRQQARLAQSRACDADPACLRP